ncbi:MAG: ATP-binding protein, partial [Alphaproteobacteria bacterium]|nr:ATP-binding protein [Alphaproteobacteria bacterium]
LTSGFKLEHWKKRPYRAPHHTASGVALVGGGCHFQKLMRLYRNRCDTLLKLVKQKQKNVSLIDQALNPRISRYCL